MDTFATITVYTQCGEDEDSIRDAISAAFLGMTEIEKLTNIYDAQSEISRINKNTSKIHTISPVIARCIAEAQRVAQLSGGSLDISIGPLMQLWDFTGHDPRVPNHEEIAKLLQYVDWTKLDVISGQLHMAYKGIGLDLGGIAKGLAVDVAMDSLQAHGIEDAMINTGSNIKAIASQLTTGKRRIWIRHPRERSEIFARFRLDGGCVATSGDYERYFVEDSIRYHHILDPRTGYPARECVSVTVTANTAIEADALSTAFFVMGPDKGLALAEKLPQVEAVFLTEHEGKIEWQATENMKNKIEIL
jgi:thiamine biosynthesis lipoprotein